MRAVPAIQSSAGGGTSITFPGTLTTLLTLYNERAEQLRNEIYPHASVASYPQLGGGKSLSISVYFIIFGKRYENVANINWYTTLILGEQSTSSLLFQ